MNTAYAARNFAHLFVVSSRQHMRMWRRMQRMDKESRRLLYGYLFCNRHTRFSLHLSKSLPVNFQQMNSRGGQKQSKGTSQTRSYQGNQHIKNNFNHFKSNLQKSAITHHSIPSINTPINPSSNPSSHPP